jgi:hypothetical protein
MKYNVSLKAKIFIKLKEVLNKVLVHTMLIIEAV